MLGQPTDEAIMKYRRYATLMEKSAQGVIAYAIKYMGLEETAPEAKADCHRATTDALRVFDIRSEFFIYSGGEGLTLTWSE